MHFSQDSDGVYFVPSFNGLQVCRYINTLKESKEVSMLLLRREDNDIFSPKAPVNDNKACVSLMGIKSTTTKAHIVRAVLESIAFR